MIQAKEKQSELMEIELNQPMLGMIWCAGLNSAKKSIYIHHNEYRWT